MRRARTLTSSEQWELLSLLGLLVVGLVALAAVWHFSSFGALTAFAVQPQISGTNAAQAHLPAAAADPGTDDGDVQVIDSVDAAGQPDAVVRENPLSGVLTRDMMPPLQPRFGPDARPKPRPRPEIRIYRGQRYAYARTVRMRVTAYAPDPRCCYPYDGKTTASGLSVKTNGGRLVAADPRIVPLHWMVSIPGYHSEQTVPVLDRGGAIKGHRLDVLLPSFDQAKEWGSRLVNVKIYRPLD
jgi:3D (Asp-Asp-Asp) domain-containing protein